MLLRNQPYFNIFRHSELNLQTTFDAAIVIPSILRPSLKKTLKSVFAQKFKGSVQILVGVDSPLKENTDIAQLIDGRPQNIAVCFFYPGYSTSVRHGGPHAACDGGSLRCMLSYMANSHHIAYLDDDNWWADTHLADLKSTIGQKPWAYSLRQYVHPESLTPICIDQWESVGPDKGVYNTRFGGFVDPNCLMINKLLADPVLRLWNHPLNNITKGMAADRHVFHALRKLDMGACTQKATSYYVLDPLDENHPGRLNLIGDAYEKAANP